MMHRIFRIILCFVVITLMGCASHQVHQQRANEIAVCKQTCQQTLKTCTQVCHKNCQTCNQALINSTARHYAEYKSEQCVQGGEIIRQLNSYRDPLQCRTISCDCKADYNVCTQSCDGLIHKRLQVAPGCC